MRRIVQQHPTLAARSLPRLVLAVATLLLTASVADAALTTGACLAQKRVAWSTLRKCQGTEEAKQLKGKPADLAQCLTKFQDALAKIAAKATKAAIACRYGDNADGTVTDYDTGLQWEEKTTSVGSGSNPADPHDVDNQYSWSTTVPMSNGTAFSDFLNRLNGCTSTDGSTVTGGFAAHCDWRLPSIGELKGIVDMTATGCGAGSPCIDPIFGSTILDYYWSTTSFVLAGDPNYAWIVLFEDGTAINGGFKGNVHRVRGVRTAM